jgi:hypothetical protein
LLGFLFIILSLPSLFSRLEWPLALCFLRAKKVELTKVLIQFLETLVSDNEVDKESDILKFQENIWGLWSDVTARLSRMFLIRTFCCLFLLIAFVLA